MLNVPKIKSTAVLGSGPERNFLRCKTWWHAPRQKQVVYWEDDTKPETMGKVRVPWNQTSVTVSGLAGNTQYFLTVSAFNTAGTGPFLPAINITTKKPRKLPHRCLTSSQHCLECRRVFSKPLLPSSRNSTYLESVFFTESHYPAREIW